AAPLSEVKLAARSAVVVSGLAVASIVRYGILVVEAGRRQRCSAARGRMKGLAVLLVTGGMSFARSAAADDEGFRPVDYRAMREAAVGTSSLLVGAYNLNRGSHGDYSMAWSLTGFGLAAAGAALRIHHDPQIPVLVVAGATTAVIGSIVRLPVGNA